MNKGYITLIFYFTIIFSFFYLIFLKDHKDMLASLMKFKAALDEQKARAENTLPEFYKNVKYQVYIR